MAASEPTGPRRGQRAILLDPLLEDASPSEPRFLRAASSAAAKLSVATSSVNLFTRNVIASDAETLQRGRAKTWIFIALLTLSAIIILAFFAATPTVIQGSLKQPTLDDYLSYAEYAPQCPCSRPITLGDAITIEVTDALNVSANTCQALMMVGQQCGGFDVRVAAPHNCTQTLAGALLWKGHLDYLGYMCDDYVGALTSQLHSISNSNLGTLLLTPEILNRTAQSTTLTAMQYVMSIAGTSFSTVENGVRTLVPVSLDLSQGSTTQTPPGCTCKAEFMADAMQAINDPCRFRALFDVRDTPDADTWWACNSASNILKFPLSLLLRNETYTALSLPPPYDTYMNFLGAGNITDNSTAEDFFVGLSFEIFPMGGFHAPDITQLRPGFLTVDFAKHFTACSPDVCTYSYKGLPSFLAALTTALGVISGLQTVLTLLVDRGYDAACKRKPAPPPDDADDGGSGAELGTLSGPQRQPAAGAAVVLPGPARA